MTENAHREARVEREQARRDEVLRGLEARLVAAVAGLKRRSSGPWVRVALPANDAPITPLPVERRKKFEAHLRSIVAQASGLAAECPDPHATIGGAGKNPVDRLLARACGICRGSCCRQAGERNAYLETDAVQLCRARIPGIADDGIVTAYTSRIPEQTYEGSCVFHGRDGCALPGWLRSEMCDWFLCESLIHLSRRVALDERATVLAVAMRDLDPVRLAVFDVDGVHHEEEPV